MNPDSEEKKFRELFLELGQQDERRAPEFAPVWAAASRLRQKSPRTHFFRVCAGTAMVAAMAVLVVLFHRAPERPAAPGFAGLQSAPSELPWQSVVLISQWRSPTDFLLQSSSERLLKTTPSYG